MAGGGVNCTIDGTTLTIVSAPNIPKDSPVFYLNESGEWAATSVSEIGKKFPTRTVFETGVSQAANTVFTFPIPANAPINDIESIVIYHEGQALVPDQASEGYSGAAINGSGDVEVTIHRELDDCILMLTYQACLTVP